MSGTVTVVLRVDEYQLLRRVLWGVGMAYQAVDGGATDGVLRMERASAGRPRPDGNRVESGGVVISLAAQRQTGGRAWETNDGAEQRLHAARLLTEPPRYQEARLS